MAKGTKKDGNGKRVTRYSYEEIKEPRTPETGHTPLLPADEEVVTLPMDNGWSRAIEVGKLPDSEKTVVVDMDPMADPVLFWTGKRNRRTIPVLPLQRNEIVSESRIAQIIDRARRAAEGKKPQRSLFSDLEKELREGDKGRRVEFYAHEEGWKNKLICGDSLMVMESLLKYEGLRGQVQMIYMDPPYGIKYNKNIQQRIDTTNVDEKDKADDVLCIKAFRDTWSLGIHSYLSHLCERLFLCRELLASSGSIFLQISDDNVHLVRQLFDEVFGRHNYCGLIQFSKATGLTSELLPAVADHLIWYAKDRENIKYNRLFKEQDIESAVLGEFKFLLFPDGTVRRLTNDEVRHPRAIPQEAKLFRTNTAVSPGIRANTTGAFQYEGRDFHSGSEFNWKTTLDGMEKLAAKHRLDLSAKPSRMYRQFLEDFPFIQLTNYWDDVRSEQKRVYTVQTSARVVARCILMTSSPGDVILDPTCGGGTTALAAEELGRRWVTCDTSRVAINVSRKRLLCGVFPHYLTSNGKISSGFKYTFANRHTLKSVAHDLEPEKVELVDQPEVDKSAIRVCGPFEVNTLGRYSAEDWKGYLVKDSPGPEGAAALENYISVICRLYRKDASVQGAAGLVHAVAESEKEKIALSVGPLTGRVTGKQIHDAYEDALSLGILEVHVLGWAFEANVGEIKSKLESRGRGQVHLVMIRPDTLAEGLKVTNPDMLFSPLSLPDIEVEVKKTKAGEEAAVTLQGVGLFDRKRRTTEYHRADSGYIAAWYLDEDYDGDCFVDCQMFFDFAKAPNLKSALRAEVDPEEYKLQLTSQPFALRGYRRIAVKVVDVYGNEATVVKDLE